MADLTWRRFLILAVIAFALVFAATVAVVNATDHPDARGSDWDSVPVVRV